MCERTPCLGTPEDIFRLVCEGYLDSLALTEWAAGERIGVPVIDMIQIMQMPCGACPLYRQGRCSIHAIKPTSGRLATHVPTDLRESPDTAVALTWLLPRNLRLIQHLFSLFQ